MNSSIPLRFDILRFVNVSRCEKSYHQLAQWSPTDWACAMAGECGEACNEVKKLRRIDDVTTDHSESTPGVSRILTDKRNELRERIANELADMVIYADLLAARLDIDLGGAVREKFNNKSDEIGSPHKL